MSIVDHEGSLYMYIVQKGQGNHPRFSISFVWQNHRELFQPTIPSLSDDHVAQALEIVMEDFYSDIHQPSPLKHRPHMIVVQGWPPGKESLGCGEKCRSLLFKYGVSLYTK